MSHRGRERQKAESPAQLHGGFSPPEQLYAQVNMEGEEPSLRCSATSNELQNDQHVNSGLQPQPFSPTTSTAKAAGKSNNKTIWCSLITFLLLGLLVVCLVAVVLYRPQVKKSATSRAHTYTMESLLSRIEQLESQVEQLKQISTQTQGTQGSVEANISQQSVFERSLSSQLNGVQNLIQSQNLIQNHLRLRQDLDRFRSVDFSRSCIKSTRSCAIPRASYILYYWSSCSTSGISIINTTDTQYYYEDMRCEYQSSNDHMYIQTATLRTSGDKYYCWCDVTRPSSYTSSSLSTHSSVYSATCTLTVTRCPRSVNLLS